MWVTGTNGLWSLAPDLMSYLEGEVKSARKHLLEVLCSIFFTYS